MQLTAYLDRIGFVGAPRPDCETLCALHRAHLLAIPYENFDVQFGRPVTIEADAAFEKLVVRRRGGWCYEMNGLFAAALEAIGFSVTRLAGGVRRDLMGEVMVGNHLVLKVDLQDASWIADVGFGDGAFEPFPLREGAIVAGGFECRLEKLDDRWWRFHNHAFGGAPSFDFTTEAADPALLAEKCAWLQTWPESPFVLNATAQRHRPGKILVLRGRILKTVRPHGVEDHLIGSADEFQEILVCDFDLDLPEAADLWPRILQRHQELFAQPA
ncbi:arylamine N-acetyltransferase [Phenylobacterium sp.]|uniref:arylamine N-acetyltransferase family protein n=1 Tax=Phenylobacterium sp. TaxID=1871053 RepID=UPI00260F8905|nr:arylamine N-acetyltransferase [Phenylobacterium sp.]